MPHVQDSLGGLIKLPLLSCSSLDPSSEINISVSVHLSNSLHWKSRSDVEWSVDVESELFVNSLGLFLLGLIKIDDIPSLVCLSMVVPYNSWSSFFICSSMDIKNLVVLSVDELLVGVLEDLPPVGVGTPDLHVLVLTRAVDIE